MEGSNNTEKLIGAFLLGAVAGAAIGILFAPDKGSETRKNISQKGDDISEAMKQKFYDFLKEIKREVDSVEDKEK